jgi:hypothetical protein
MISTARSNYPEMLKKFWLPISILELLAFFHQILKILKLFVFYFKNYNRLMLSLNSKHVKIYLACNFKVNLITHLEVIALFSSNFKNVNTFHPLFQKL